MQFLLKPVQTFIKFLKEKSKERLMKAQNKLIDKMILELTQLKNQDLDSVDFDDLKEAESIISILYEERQLNEL